MPRNDLQNPLMVKASRPTCLPAAAMVCVLAFGGPASAASFTTAELVQACTVAAQSERGRPLSGDDVVWVASCYGFMHGIAYGLNKIHQFYAMSGAASSNNIDEAKRSLAVAMGIGPDVCLPENLTGAEMARLIAARAAQKRAADRDLAPGDLARSALTDAFPCSQK